jgi:SAM-dependent methyltransferase
MHNQRKYIMQRDIAIDHVHDRLVFLMGAPDRDYWESVWNTLLTRENIVRGDRFVTNETARVLAPGARVVDAGCGIGQTVHGLAKAGYDAHGIDYADKTVAAIKALVPELKVQVGDVRAMPFEDGSLDGVWSLGVIEHFYDGYDEIIAETRRILRPGGYLFLTVPTISPMKALRARLGRYPSYHERERARFFQFAFRRSHVVDHISKQGFQLERSFGRSGAFGLSEDAPTLTRALMLRQEWRALPARAWWRAADYALTPFSYHTRYYLFRKTA